MKRSKIACSLVQELTSHFQGVFYGRLCRKIAWPVRLVMEVKHSWDALAADTLEMLQRIYGPARQTPY